jgi:hypothetical protein
MPELMVRALYKEIKIFTHSGSCVRGELPAERLPVRPFTVLPVLLPDGTVAATHKDVEAEVTGVPGGGRSG